MTIADLEHLVGLLTEPTVGIPFLLTLAAVAGWLLWSPRPLERPPAIRRTWFPPTVDPVSQIYYALADGRYSAVLGTVYERLDGSVEKKYGLVIGQIPVFRPDGSGIPDASGLKRAAKGIRRVYAEALQRESPFWFRWAFWRSAEADEQRFLSRVDDAISVSSHWISTLEGTP